MNKNIVKSFTKTIIKWLMTGMLGIIVIFLFIVILNTIKNKYRSKQGFKSKNITVLHPVSASRSINLPNSLMSGKSKRKTAKLKDIFNLPDKNDDKFNSPFLTKSINTSKNINYVNHGRNLPNFLKNIKFKRFPNKKTFRLSVIFITNKIALIKINGGKYYVHSGENIKGVFILKVNLSGISYSRNGKIKIKHLGIS